MNFKLQWLFILVFQIISSLMNSEIRHSGDKMSIVYRHRGPMDKASAS